MTTATIESPSPPLVLFESCMGLSRHIARKFWATYFYSRDQGDVSLDDLVQEADTELWKAAMTFDPERNPSFAARAGYCVAQRLTTVCREHAPQKNVEAEDHFWHARRSVCASPIDENDEMHLAGGFAPSAEEEVMDTLYSDLAEAMKSLRPKELFTIKGIISGLNQEQCAEAMAQAFGDKSAQQNVSYHLRMARRKIAERIVL